MEAKDTVMSEEQCIKVYQRAEYKIVDGEYNRQRQAKLAVAEAQAEISFKAGIEQGFKQIDNEGLILKSFENGRRQGIKEVVEYLRPFTVEAPMAGVQLGQFIIHLERPEWRVKLKEWGIAKA